MRVRAVYEKGVLVPREPLDLPEHVEVEIEVRLVEGEMEARADDPGDPTGWVTMRRFIGLWQDAPADDLAEKHDEYLYGARRRMAGRPGTSRRQP